LVQHTDVASSGSPHLVVYSLKRCHSPPLAHLDSILTEEYLFHLHTPPFYRTTRYHNHLPALFHRLPRCILHWFTRRMPLCGAFAARTSLLRHLTYIHTLHLGCTRCLAYALRYTPFSTPGRPPTGAFIPLACPPQHSAHPTSCSLPAVTLLPRTIHFAYIVPFPVDSPHTAYCLVQ